MKILHVVGARPNFMKVAPVQRSLSAYEGVHQVLVHTGQHYDFNMSEVFFQQLGMAEPDVNLGVGSGTHARQTADIMRDLEPVIVDAKPDLVLVYGDVNSTVAAALVCSKLMIAVGHVEAGLRSFDRSMPEEINRLLTDQISDLLFTPSQDGNDNLVREGIDRHKIHLVGNVMIDTLARVLPTLDSVDHLELPPRYALVTLHRPSNVDDVSWLDQMLRSLAKIGQHLAVLFPVHPRTRQRIAEGGLSKFSDEGVLRLMDPLPYIEFVALQRRAAVVITDSGGIQEETTFLRVPCLTVRENTERPITVDSGTNTLVGRDVNRIGEEILRILAGKGKTGEVPPLWDGHASGRIAEIITRAAW